MRLITHDTKRRCWEKEGYTHRWVAEACHHEEVAGSQWQAVDHAVDRRGDVLNGHDVTRGSTHKRSHLIPRCQHRWGVGRHRSKHFTYVFLGDVDTTTSGAT